MTNDIELDDGIRRAREHLLSLQRPDGHWVGEMEGDTILESEYILLMRILGSWDVPRLEKAAEYIRRKQLACGGWAIYPDGPADLSASVKAYWALKLLGTGPDETYMRSARQCILDLGGARMSNSYTRFYLAALGQMSWDDAPAVPPEIILLPRWFYFNIYEISSWSRTFVVPLSIIWAHKPVIGLSDGEGIGELFVPGRRWDERIGIFSWKRVFLIVDHLLKSAEKRGLHRWRKRALVAAEQWMFERFEQSAGLGAIYPPIVYSLIALRCLGYSDDHSDVIRAKAELERLAIEDEDTLRFQPCKSPVWDTAIVLNALKSGGGSGVSGAVDGVALGTDWLISKEVRTRGDWSVKRPRLEPGGWYFEYENEFYPDIDDTAMVLLAIEGAGSDAIRRGIDWILAMQGRDGGWASFDVDNNRRLFCSIPFADHNAMIDPSTVDITARVLEMLGIYGYGLANRQVRKAVQFVVRRQEADGSWYGRWGVNYVYGTFQCLKGLRAIGIPADHPSVVLGARWLVEHQNPDGGWGESIASYDVPSLRGRGMSTASQTAWAVMGLISAGWGDGEAVRRGIDFLLRNQNPDGTWDEPEWTGTGFPKVFYLRYETYRLSFPLWALGMYRQWREEAL